MNKTLYFKARVLALAVLAVLLFVSFGWAATYYVDATNGSDTNSGLLTASAWKTIAKVNASQFSPRDQILFKRGEVWRETLLVPSSGAPGKQIVFGAYGSGDKPILKGSDMITGWINEGQNIWSAAAINEPNVVWFGGLSGAKKTSKSQLVSPNDWYWTSNMLSIYSASSPTQVEAASRANNVNSYGRSHLKFTNLIFQNGGNGPAGGSLVINSSDVEVDSCDFLHSHTCHIGIWGTASGNITVSKSTFQYSGLGRVIGSGNAIDVTTEGTAPQVTIQNSTFTKIGNYPGSGNHDHGIYFKAGRLVWRYNYQYDGGTETGASVKISVNAQDGCEIYYNIISSAGGTQSWGVLSEAGTGHTVYNNIFYDVDIGVWLSGPNGPYVPGGSGMTVKNNVFHTTNRYFIHGAVNTNFVSDYNVFYNGPAYAYLWGTSYYTYDQWKVNSGQDAHSSYTDPKFIDPIQGNFALQPSSPCINTGTTVGLTQDFNGVHVPQDRSVDIGAFERIRINPPINLRIIP
jgi:hypothetical protein